MADGETETETTTDPIPDPAATGESPAPPASEPAPPPPPAVDELTELRERLARLEGENRALRERPPEKAAETPPPLTPERVEAAFQGGQITDAQRIDYLAQIRFQTMRAQWVEEEAEQRSQELAHEKLDGYLREYPDLGNPQSELIAKVNDELKALKRLNPRINPQDVRDQILAVERVVGGHKLGGPKVPDDREFERRRRPTGSPGVTPGSAEPPKPKDKSQGEQLWERMNEEGRQAFVSLRGSKDAALKTLNHATPESIRAMDKAGRFAR